MNFIKNILILIVFCNGFSFVNAFVTFEQNYEISGNNIITGFVKDSDIINYNINYTGNAISSGLYSIDISTGGCFDSINIDTGSTITYYTDRSNYLTSSVLNCDIRSLDIKTINNNYNEKKLITTGNNITWNGSLNDSDKGIYTKYDSSLNETQLYVRDGMQSVLVDTGDSITWNGYLNNNGYGNYTKYDSSLNETQLYVRDGMQSVLVDTGDSITWNGSLNNTNNSSIYTKYDPVLDETQLYIRDGMQSVLVDTGSSVLWYSSLNNNNASTYLKQDPVLNETQLYVRDGMQSVLVDTGSNFLSWYGSLNDNNKGTYAKYDPVIDETQLYIRDGMQSVLVGAGDNIAWNGSLNNNNNANYRKYDSVIDETQLYIRDGMQSVLVDTGNIFLSWNGSLNNNNNANYRKYDFGLNQHELYVRDGMQSILVDTGNSIAWNGGLNSSNNGSYSKYDVSLNESKLYIWDGMELQSILVDTGYSLRWDGGLNNNNNGSFTKYDVATQIYELYIYRKGDLDYTGGIVYSILLQSGVVNSNITNFIVSGNYITLSGGIYFEDIFHIYKFNFAGGGSSIFQDSCPLGDYSNSYYDNICIPDSLGEEEHNDLEFVGTGSNIYYNYCSGFHLNDNNIIDSKTLFTTNIFKKSLRFLYGYDMTLFNAIDDFSPYNELTREQAAKIFSNFSINVLCKVPDKSLNISYDDTNDSDSTLKPYIKLSYQLGLMKGNKNKFRPFDTITNEEFKVVLVRMLLGIYISEDGINDIYEKYNIISQKTNISKYSKSSRSMLKRSTATINLYKLYIDKNIFTNGLESFKFWNYI